MKYFIIVSLPHTLVSLLRLPFKHIMSNSLQLAVVRVQCNAVTKLNRPCRLNATETHMGRNYCWRHFRLANPSAHVVKPSDIVTINAKEDDCSICYTLLDDPATICMTNCSHVFHLACINKWKDAQSLQRNNSTCPNCRKRMTMYRASSRKKVVLMTNLELKIKIAGA